MSQLQVQHKTALVNGASRRRGDQDFGNGADNFRREYQSNRSSRSGLGHQSRMEGGAHQHMNQAGSISKEKAEALPRGESKGGSQGSWNQHLLHLTACLVGQPVEVQVKCGSIYSGVFHTANAEKDHGIVLKMARLIKDGSSKGKCDNSEMRPHKKYIIHAKDLVQIIAKDVPLRGETLQNGRMRENRAEMVTDTVLSQGRHGDLERELKPWTPDAEDFKDLGLESTFESKWNRNWDQFEINRTLFGVESTFDEELYTTKLEKGPQMREREREAYRIAREMEEQSAKNHHLAEERGPRWSKDLAILDEESMFSSVLRSSEDVGEENEDVNVDALNGGPFENLQNRTVADMTSFDGEHSLMKGREIESKKTSRPSVAGLKKDSIVASVDMHITAAEILENTHKEKSPCAVVEARGNKYSVRVGGFPSPRPTSSIGDATGLQALNLDPGSPHVSEDVYRDFNEFRQQENAKRGRQLREEQVNELKSFGKSLKELKVKRHHSAAPAGSTRKTAAACAPPASALPLPTSIANPISTVVGLDSGTGSTSLTQLTPSSTAVESTRVVTNEGGLGLGLPQSEQPSINSLSVDTPISPINSANSTTMPSSPSSSSDVSSIASFPKKSSLNPHAKEFKLNPNAKSFTPNFTPLRPPSPVVPGTLYVPGMLPQGPSMQGLPIQLPQGGQPATKYTPYNNLGVAGASGGASFLPSPGTFTPGASGVPMQPPMGAGQTTMKGPPPLQQQVGGHPYGSHQQVRYSSQAPVVPASTYLHPNAHMYSQQMMFGQPGQMLYFPAYPPGMPMPPPQPTSAASQLQTNHRGAGMQEMQVCMTPPSYIAGPQHFVPQGQMPQLSNPMQPTAGSLTPNSMPTIQPPQGVAGGIIPQTLPTPTGGTISKTPVIRLGGVGTST